MTTSVASDDPVYDGFVVDDIDAVNQDDDSAAGIDVSTGVTTTTEAGGSFAISYTLTSAPTAAVVLTVASRRRHERSHRRARAAHLRRRDVGPAPSPSPSPARMTTWPTAMSRSQRHDQCRQRRPGLRRLRRG
ncbi:MAG: hypothetical protein H6644_01395 [Caldilineaceae bacterium]|nr:hypothetical protein [Caldilineaceae bacterium]